MTENVSDLLPDWPVTVISVVSPGFAENADVGVWVGVSVGKGVIVDVGSCVGTVEIPGRVVVKEGIRLSEAERCVVHPVTRMRKAMAMTGRRRYSYGALKYVSSD